VESNTDTLNAHRRNLVEMLFVEGNHFCMFCEKSGNCELQALAYRMGITAPRYPYLFPKRELDASHRTCSSTATAACCAAAACGPRRNWTAKRVRVHRPRAAQAGGGGCGRRPGTRPARR